MVRSPRRDATKKLYDLGLRAGGLNSTHALTLQNVEEVVKQIRKIRERAGLGMIPYYHLVQGAQCDTMVVSPDEIGLQMLAAFIGGADSVQLYYFPVGYDGRYWRSAAQANNVIAAYEG